MKPHESIFTTFRPCPKQPDRVLTRHLGGAPRSGMDYLKYLSLPDYTFWVGGRRSGKSRRIQRQAELYVKGGGTGIDFSALDEGVKFSHMVYGNPFHDRTVYVDTLRTQQALSTAYRDWVNHELKTYKPDPREYYGDWLLDY